MAVINQLHRRNGLLTPYFVIGPPGQIPHAVAHLFLNYSYPCGPHCRGLIVAAWQGRSAAAVAPMIELDLDQQKAQDVRYPPPASPVGNVEPLLTPVPASRVRRGTPRAAVPSREGRMEATALWYVENARGLFRGPSLPASPR